MRVAFQADQLAFTAPGGIATYVRNLAPALAAQGADLTLFHARLERWRDEPWMEGIAVREIPRGIRTLYPAWDLLGRPALGLSADLVHVTNPAAVPGREPGRALVVTVHDLAFERFPRLFPTSWRLLYRAGLRAAARRADAILVPSRSTRDDLLMTVRVDPDRVWVTPLAAAPTTGSDGDLARERRERLHITGDYVLCAGTLEPRKNLVRLVRAYRRAVSDRGLGHALVLAGPIGWGIESLHRELAVEGPGEIILTGGLQSADLDAVMRGASAFVYPSLYEGFGLPVLEAMTRGIPVITSNVSSLPEVAGDAALLVDPRSEDAIADAMLRVLGDGDLAARLSVTGRERAAAFSWEATARATTEVYRRVVT